MPVSPANVRRDENCWRTNIKVDINHPNGWLPDDRRMCSLHWPPWKFPSGFQCAKYAHHRRCMRNLSDAIYIAYIYIYIYIYIKRARAYTHPYMFMYTHIHTHIYIYMAILALPIYAAKYNICPCVQSAGISELDEAIRLAGLYARESLIIDMWTTYASKKSDECAFDTRAEKSRFVMRWLTKKFWLATEIEYHTNGQFRVLSYPSLRHVNWY